MTTSAGAHPKLGGSAGDPGRHNRRCPGAFVAGLVWCAEHYGRPTRIADMIDKGMTVRQQRAEGYWMDIGRPPDYAQANADFGSVFET